LGYLKVHGGKNLEGNNKLFMHYPSIFLAGLRKTMKYVSGKLVSALRCRTPEYKAGALTTELKYLVFIKLTRPNTNIT
jgi:hypothetical protein